MKRLFNVILITISLIALPIYTGCQNVGENCPLPAGASSNFTGDPCQLAVLNQSGSFVGTSSCPCTLVGLDNTTLTATLTSKSQLINCDLTNANLSNLNLTGVDFTGATLTNATLTGCILDQAIFQNANDMTGINLSNTKSANGAHFNNSPLYGATLSGNFAGAIFDSTGLAGATIDNSNFTGASFLTLIPYIGSETKFTNPKGQTVIIAANDPLDLTGSVLNNVNFSGAKMNGIQLTNCILNNVNFTGTDLSTSPGSQTKTSFANVNNVQSLQKNKLSASNLANPAINFTNANLANATFANASLNGINLNVTDISGVDFSNATLINVQFGPNLIGTGLDFTGATLQNITGLDIVLTNTFKNCIFNCPANISFKNAAINSLHLGGSDNTPATLGADFTNATFGPGTNISNIGLYTGPTTFSNLNCNGTASNPVNLSFGIGLSPYNFTNCNFNYTNFSTTGISGFTQNKCNYCNFNGTDFSNLDLTNTTFTSPNFQNIIVQSVKSVAGSNFCQLMTKPIPGCKCKPTNKQYTAFTCTNP